jgi:hypothetical protein
MLLRTNLTAKYDRLFFSGLLFTFTDHSIPSDIMLP